MNAIATPSVEVKCSTVVKGKQESFKIRVNQAGEPIFWSKSKIIEASKSSYFALLADLENFGLEGKKSFSTSNGFKVLRVTNTAEQIELGLNKSLSKGYYAYRDGGSGLGNSSLELSCRPNRP